LPDTQPVVNGTATSGSITAVLVGNVTVRASSAALATDDTSFTVVPGAPSAVVYVSPNTADLASGSGRAFTARIRDAAGNTVTGYSGSITFAKQAGPGTVTGLPDTQPVVNGTATSGSITAVLVGNVTVRASSAALATDDTSFTAVHGAAAKISLSGLVTDLASGSARVLTATTQDAAGNTITSGPDSTLTVAFGQTAGAGTVTGLGSSNASAGVASRTVTGGLIGSVTLRATSGTLANGAGNPMTFMIAAANSGTSLSIAPGSVQYSDVTTLTATITPYDLGPGGVATGKVEFFAGTTKLAETTTITNGVATVSPQVFLAPASYTNVTATFTSTNPQLIGSTSPAKSLTVTPEDADATYSGPALVFTPSVSTSSASVLLQAVITDSDDGNRGAIRNAIVDFVDPTTGAIYCTVTYGDRATAGFQFLVDIVDATSATVGCTHSFTAGTDSNQYDVGIKVRGYYVRAAAEDALLTVSLPLATQFITGGGYLKLTDKTSGSLAGDVGSKTNFGFNVKYNNKGTNLQGRVNVIIRRAGHVYQVKGNNLGSLGVTYCKVTGTGTSCGAAPSSPCTFTASATCYIKATFRAQANVTDVTNPLLPITVASGATLQMDMTDFGEPGSNGPAGPDTMGLTLSDKSGSLLYSSNWVSGRSIEQLLTGGNLVVH
jgi:hypothetical protein